MARLQHNILLLLTLLCMGTVTAQENERDVQAIIRKMDRVYFNAYNTCDMEKQASLYSDDLEFYHDKGGLSTSKREILKSIQQNICGKVTRELVKGSIEVYEIKGFGAVEIGMHKFHNAQEPNAISKPGKFVMIWKKTGNDWQISRVISLH